MTLLCDLARKYSTDKGGSHFTYNGQYTDCCHNYTPVYAKLFEGKEDQVKHVLEIGVNQGCSLRMWKEYFSNASIVGIDIDENCLFAEPRITCLQADQNDPKSLCSALAMLHPDGPLFDLIIDDGSHEREHQITSMRTLLPFLNLWGHYVIEDLGAHPHADVFKDIFNAIPQGPYIVTLHRIEGGLGPKTQPYEWLISIQRVSS